RKFAGKKHIARLVDEIARPQHSLCSARDRCPCLFGCRRIGASEAYFDFCRPLLSLLRLGLVAIKPVGAQACPDYEVGNLLRLEGPRPEFGDDGWPSGSSRNPPHGAPPAVRQVPLRLLVPLASAHLL